MVSSLCENIKLEYIRTFDLKDTLLLHFHPNGVFSIRREVKHTVVGYI